MFRKLLLVLSIGLVGLALTIGWQVGASEVANIQLQDDLHDLASRLDTRIGFSVPKSDDDYRNEVVRRAQKHGIELQPEEATVERHGSGDSETISLAADYTVPIKLPGFSFALHFTPKSTKD